MDEKKEYVVINKPHFGFKETGDFDEQGEPVRKAHTYKIGEKIGLTDEEAANLVNKVKLPGEPDLAAQNELETLKAQLAAKEAELKQANKELVEGGLREDTEVED